MVKNTQFYRPVVPVAVTCCYILLRLYVAVLEVVAAVDFGTDALLLKALVQSEHRAWTSITLLTLFSGAITFYEPLISNLLHAKMRAYKAKHGKGGEVGFANISTPEAASLMCPSIFAKLLLLDVVYMLCCTFF